MKLGRALLVLGTALLSALALVASAAGTSTAHPAHVKHLQLPVAALAMDGDRVAYDLTTRYSATTNATNKVLVWNVRTGKTIKVSGKKTAAADSSSTGAGVIQLAIAGSRVAWLLNLGGNLEGDDYLLTSSVTSPKERQVVSAVRVGDNCAGRGPHCAGPWLGGLVGSGNSIALNRWTTDSQGNVASGGLYALKGTRLHPIATGASTVWAVASDGGREAVLRSDGSVAVYSASGKVLVTVNPPGADAVALSGKNLVVLTQPRTLALYDAQTGLLKKTLAVQGKGQQNLDVQGNVAIYTTGSSVHAVNLLTGRDRAVGTLPTRIALARIDGAGLAYAGNGVRGSFGKGTLDFVPMARIKAAVS
jgi:hypothetical protein